MTEREQIVNHEGESEVTLLGNYPRSMGHPRQDFVAHNDQERESYIRKYIKHCDLYMSVYSFQSIIVEDTSKTEIQLDRNAPIIDKVFFDFDTDDWFKDLTKFHQWCSKRNLIHRTHASGRGGHGFVFTTRVDHPKEAIGNFSRYLKKKLGLTPDMKIAGDTSRIFRIPNTFNFNARRFCIAFPPEWLDKGATEQYIAKVALRQINENPWCGENLLDLRAWDVAEILYVDNPMSAEYSIGEAAENIRLEYPEFPPCVQSWLSNPLIDDENKFYLATYLKDQTAVSDVFSAQEIVNVMRNSLSPGEFSHYFGKGKGDLPRRHYGHNGIKFRLAMRKDYYLPDCETIQAKGYCPQTCEAMEKAGRCLAHVDGWTCEGARAAGLCPISCERRHPIYK